MRPFSMESALEAFVSPKKSAPPTVRHTFEGLIIFMWISFVIINHFKVCRTAGCLFQMTWTLLKLIPSKKSHNKLIFILLKFIAAKGCAFSSAFKILNVDVIIYLIYYNMFDLIFDLMFLKPIPSKKAHNKVDICTLKLIAGAYFLKKKHTFSLTFRLLSVDSQKSQLVK